MMRRRIFLGIVLTASVASAEPTLDDYRYFRALSVDLNGRMPTRDEIAAFEKPDFNIDAWIDEKLTGPMYTARVRGIYMDLLRLQVGTQFQFAPSPSVLRQTHVLGPDGTSIAVLYRSGQRRVRDEFAATDPRRYQTDGDFCMTTAETGLEFVPNAESRGVGIPVSQTVLDARTVVVRPWWLYRDYKSAAPTDRYQAGGAGWSPTYRPSLRLLTQDGGVDAPPVTEIRVCREEAQTAASGAIYNSKRPKGLKFETRYFGLPTDQSYAVAHEGEMISCSSSSSFAMTKDCGCGPGLERCNAGGNASFDPTAFLIPQQVPLGLDTPFDTPSAQAQSSWERLFWKEEALHFMDSIFDGDRDFREILTSKTTFVNGPLVKFYKYTASATCCSGAALGGFEYVTPDALIDPSALPDLLPHDVDHWQAVTRKDRASGILTMPVFLTKYGTRRARAHVLYNAFMCRDFVSGNVELKPSPPGSNPNNLIERPGCSTCHQTLEPLAAYFSRVTESDWTYLPADKFPLDRTACAMNDAGVMNTNCIKYYDPAFSDGSTAKLRGAYGSAANAEAGPAGLAKAITEAPEFPGCVADNVAGALLGRTMSSDDSTLRDSLKTAFVGGDYKMRALVKAIVKSDAYKHANNLSSAAWRKEHGGAE